MKFIIDTVNRTAYLYAENKLEETVLYQFAPLIGLSGVECNEHQAGVAGKRFAWLDLKETK